MNLVIIEGVGKRETIKKYLGSDYEVVATKGHIRDLPEKSLGVNVLDNFKPQYEIMPDKKDVVKMLKEKSAKADKVYLATDPDREGEAISWHLAHILEMDKDAPIRVAFNEISKDAIHEGLKNPRAIDQNLVDAQQARRVLDRLMGYKISPILCKKIQPKLSAGRVQSATLKLVVDRENAIRKFKPEEYWTLVANLKKSGDVFKTTLTKIKNKKATISNKEQMDGILESLKSGEFVVKEVKKTIAKSHPAAPYTTSTMQQEASSKLGMSLKKVTSCAQELYEGVEIAGEGKVALVTYIRTDSVRIAPGAVNMAREFIKENFGEKYLPKTPNVYKSKKSAQDAHEAIRPINLNRTPEKLKGLLSPDNYKLYKLIYNKFLACQMEDATYNSVVALISNGEHEFKASGKTPIFDGYLKVFDSAKKSKKEEPTDDEEQEDNNVKLPPMEEGDRLDLENLIPTQKFTKPDPRYTESTLVKEMEDKGIGRPATTTPTVVLLFNRKYIEKDAKFIKPTELGEKVNEYLDKFFGSIINTKFTAEMEDKLDDVALKGIVWQNFVKDFYADFVKLLGVADKDSVKYKIPPKETDIKCDKCGHMMVIRTGKFGEFLACSNFPACKNVQPMRKDCGICPKCGKPAVEKRSKKGTIFYGCSDYPTCDFVSWEIPLEEKCPKCGSYLTGKKIYNNLRKKCSNTSCDFTESVKIEAKPNDKKE